MRYDDPSRPRSTMNVEAAPLQINGSVLPVITLIRPMESEADVEWRCAGREGCVDGDRTGEGYDGCEACERSHSVVWGWLASIHAHRESNRFGYHTAFIADLGEFQRAYLDDPESALARWFKYYGPEKVRESVKPQVDDLWEDEK